jgi:hypothetical protein
VSTSRYQRRSQPRLVWRPSLELWGPQTFKVFVDGAEVATTGSNELIVPVKLPTARTAGASPPSTAAARWWSTPNRLLRVDSVAPRARVSVRRPRRRGGRLSVRVSAADGKGLGHQEGGGELRRRIAQHEAALSPPLPALGDLRGGCSA